MKKLVLSLAVIAGMTMVACGSSENKAEATDSVAAEETVEAVETVDSNAVAVDSNAVAVDSVAKAE